jgi:hypothetical protein
LFWWRAPVACQLSLERHYSRIAGELAKLNANIAWAGIVGDDLRE